MLMRICALYERRIGILAFPVIIAICGITTGIVRYHISPSISEADNIKSKVGMVRSPEKDMPTIQFHCDSGLNAAQYANFLIPPSPLLMPAIRAYCMLKHFLKGTIWVYSHLIDLAGAFGGEFVFDVAIFAMTLHKTLTLRKGSGFGLLTMIMRDGMYNCFVYFCCTATKDLISIGTVYFG
jgi:hypothetical protein